MFFVAKSEKMREAVRLAERVAPTDAIVLITGESGTGKNAIAEFIHFKSKRSSQNLVKIDCAALSAGLLEAELFGHERGAFTGATDARPGRLEAAHKSTLLLDEIALLPIDAQAKLLRVLETGEFDRLGGRKTVKIDARILATTNVDLERAVERKTFREDLFFRLNVVRLELPPLRERREDAADLARHFLEIYRAKHVRDADLALSRDAVKVLQAYDFPGNLRELANIIERAVITTENDQISADDLPANLTNSVASGENRLTLAQMEARYVLETLRFAKGNKSEAARLLDISRKNLYERLAKYAE